MSARNLGATPDFSPFPTPHTQSTIKPPQLDPLKTGPDSDPCETTLVLAITMISCLNYYSSLLLGRPCFLLAWSSVLHKQPEGFLDNTRSEPILPLLKTLLWPYLTWSQSQRFLNSPPYFCHPLPSHLVFCPPPTEATLLFTQAKPIPTSGPLHFQLPLMDHSSPEFQSSLETITSFSSLS